MTTSHSEWYQTLDADTKAAINQLRRHRPIWNLVLPLFVLMWIGLGVLAMRAPHWSILILAYVLMGMIIHGIGNFMHEGIHGNMFRSKGWNRWVGFLAGLPTFLSVSAFGTDHLLHHKYTRTTEDPDELLQLADRPVMQSFWFYAWIVLGTIIYGVRLPWVILTRATEAEKMAVLTERVVMLALLSGLFAAAYFFDFFPILVHCWFIPLVVAIFLVNMRGWAEHQLTDTDHPLRQTRTVTSTRFYSFLNINLNYHLEHHLFPSVPWYNLPAVHRLLLPEFEKAGASVYRSYFWFIWDALRIGVHGRTPDFSASAVAATPPPGQAERAL